MTFSPDNSPASSNTTADNEPLVRELARLKEENEALRQRQQAVFDYIRAKVDQLLIVTGTVPLKPEELDDETMLQLDPIGIISDSFSQILVHLRETNIKLSLARDEIEAIFDSVGGGLLVLDHEMKVITYNQKMKDLFLGQMATIIGRPCHELLCGDEMMPHDICVIKDIFTTNQSARKSWAHGQSHYEVIATPLFDKQGQISQIVILYLDVTERVMAVAALKQSEERYRTLVEAANDAIFLADTETGLILEVNRKGEELLGRPASEIIGMHHAQLHPPAQHEPARKGFKKNIQAMTATARDMTVRHRDGHEIPVEISSNIVELGGKEIMLGIFRDITERRKMEEEMQRAQKLESVGVLAGGIAHDFNNLLTAFLGNITLAKMRSTPGDGIYDRLSAAEDATMRAKDLTQQLLTFAKGGAPVTKSTTVASLLEDAATFFLRGSKVSCECSFPADLKPVEVDEGQFSQVINNLIINSEQAMPDGGTITIRAANRTIDDNGSLPLAPGEYIEISLIDQGLGIPAEHLGKIFDPFFSTKQKGSGLGLATAYSIIKNHGGHITAESDLGTGTTFHIYLPVAQKQPPAIEEEKREPTMGTGRILLMDDDFFVRETAAMMLEELGFEVTPAADGQEAISLYKAALEAGAPFDAVIMDLTIPGGMGGKEAIAVLRAFAPQVKAVVSSGYANDPVMANFKEYGFCGVVPKPYKLKTLSETMNKILA